MDRRLKAFIQKIELVRPSNARELRDTGYRVRRIGTGVCRFVYSVNDFPLVIKFPRNSRVPLSKFGFKTMRTCIRHSQIEIDVIRHVGKYAKFKPLRRYMPKIFYFDYRRGVVAMEKYERISPSSAIKQVSSVIKDLVIDLFPKLKYPKHVFDLCSRNLGRDRSGRLVFIDLGLLECKK